MISPELALKEITDETTSNLTKNFTYKVTLPTNNVEVEIKFLTSGDEKKLMNLTEQRRKHKLLDTSEENLQDFLSLNYILSVPDICHNQNEQYMRPNY